MKNVFKTVDEIKTYCAEENAQIGFSEDAGVFQKGRDINGIHVPNSIAILPMEGCDALPDGSPGELTRRRYLRFGMGGAGIVWCEAIAVVEEGRASKQQLFIHRGNVDAFRRLLDEVKEASVQRNGYAPLMIAQLTHSGRYSKPQGTPAPVLAARNPALDDKYGISADRRPISDAELRALEDRFAEAAALAQAAGFDGVDIKASHGYLLSELLSAHTREGEYGGDYAGRTRFIKNAAAKIGQAVDKNMVLATRLSLYDAMDYPYGFGVDRENAGRPDLTEPAALLGELAGLGVSLCGATMGNPYLNPHVNRPYDSGGYAPPEPPVKGVERLISLTAAVKRMVSGMLFIGAGYSWLKQFAVQAGAYALAHGHADFIGFGRLAFAYPDFARDILQNGGLDRKQTCITCSKCSQLMRGTITAGCVIHDNAVYAPLYQKLIQK
jgi:2,4-dienoyl-CoA reductase-like NADH-dependent reductase (Old Yellow Enzyme family)